MLPAQRSYAELREAVQAADLENLSTVFETLGQLLGGFINLQDCSPEIAYWRRWAASASPALASSTTRTEM